MDFWRMAEPTLYIKSTHKAMKTFAESIAESTPPYVSALHNLLEETAQKRGWQMVTNGDSTTRIFQNEFAIPCAYWQVIENGQALPAEEGNRLVLCDNDLILLAEGAETRRSSVTDTDQMAEVLNQFFDTLPGAIGRFEEAVGQYKPRLAALQAELLGNLAKLRTKDAGYKRAFDAFFALVSDALYARLEEATAERLLLEHLLTVPMLNAMCEDEGWASRNHMSQAAERVWQAVPSDVINRDEVRKYLDQFYRALKGVTVHLPEWSARQRLLLALYDRFIGDPQKSTHTHQPPSPELVNVLWVMVRDVLKQNLKHDLHDKTVKVLDISGGTGEIACAYLRLAPESTLPEVYQHQIFVNEASLFHFYLAQLNIERVYQERAGQAQAFKHVCYVDTLDLKKRIQMALSLFREDNDLRLEDQQNTPFTIIIGDPTWHAHRLPEKRRYKALKRDLQLDIDDRIENTYLSASAHEGNKALNNSNAARFLRWASERLEGRPGIICLVSSNDLVASQYWDGVRSHLQDEFEIIYHLSLEGGTGVTLLARTGEEKKRKYHYKLESPQLTQVKTLEDIPWHTLRTNPRHGWHVLAPITDYQAFMPLDEMFKTHSRGISTRRDAIVTDYQQAQLRTRVERFIQDYNAEVERSSTDKEFKPSEQILWSKSLKQALKEKTRVNFTPQKIRTMLYRPFAKRHLYFDPLLNEDTDQFGQIFPTAQAEATNRVLCLTHSKLLGFAALLTNHLPEANLFSATVRCFPLYIYVGESAQGNIRDEALERFHTHYYDTGITKADLFYYTYAVLHHPAYLTTHHDSLKQAPPRIPFSHAFYELVDIGQKLAQLHLEYEAGEKYPLVEKLLPGKEADFSVVKMRLSKDNTALRVNSSLTLENIPAEAFSWQIGKRSALEWVLEQYRQQTDRRSGLTLDPNLPDQPRFIVDLVSRVIQTSLQTAKLTQAMPALFE
jgi:predicted helicase